MKIIETEGSATIKAWVDGVPVESGVWDQIKMLAKMPFIKGIALMPDCHVGIGSTVGTVFASTQAIIPSTVGVDIGCGMCAVRTSLTAKDLPESLEALRNRWESAVPVGFGLYHTISREGNDGWKHLDAGYQWLKTNYPKIVLDKHPINQLGSLGGGNHFEELCLDKEGRVWVMLHSGSRGIGNKIGTFFIAKAKEELAARGEKIPHQDLSYFNNGTDSYNDYLKAMMWAQDYAATSREVMLKRLIAAMRNIIEVPFTIDKEVINCHHNYVTTEVHFGEQVLVTRKGAVRAGLNDMCIIPGSMGAKSFIARGLGNADSYMSCSHGAGRVMSRSKAKVLISLEDHERDTAGVECRKDIGMLDESPKAYKDIVTVMKAQEENVSIEHELKQIMCVKG